MKPPSFEPWLGRVRIARAWAAAIGCAMVTLLGYQSGIPMDDAVLRGLIAAIVCYFVGWASALWICGELYGAQVARVRRRLQERENARQQQLQQLYDTRVAAMSDSENSLEPMAAPPRREAA